MSERRRARTTKRVVGNGSLPVIKVNLKQLPTRGIGYPEGTSISYRTYTFGEVKKSSTSTKSVVNSMKLALSCLTVTGMDKMQLSVMDMFYLGLLIKSSSLGGEKFELPFVCPHCGERGKKVLTQSDIEFVDMDERITELPIKAELQGQMISFAPMTVKQFIDLYNGVYNSLLRDGEPDAVSALAMLNKTMSFKESYDFLYGMTDSEDSEIMNEIDQALMHNLKPVEAKCGNDKCLADLFVKMEGKEALLQPFRDGERSDRPRIFFQSAPKHDTDTPIQDGVSNCEAVEQQTN